MADAPVSLPASLQDLRQAILALDAELVALLNRRAALSLAVGERKRTDGQSDIFRPGREVALMRQLEAMSSGSLPIEHLRTIYREILSSSRNLQRPERVAFAGPKDSPAHSAGRKMLGRLPEFPPKPSLAEVFAAIADGTCDLGIVPLASAPTTEPLACFPHHPELRILAETGARPRFAVIGRTPSENR